MNSLRIKSWETQKNQRLVLTMTSIYERSLSIFDLSTWKSAATSGNQHFSTKIVLPFLRRTSSSQQILPPATQSTAFPRSIRSRWRYSMRLHAKPPRSVGGIPMSMEFGRWFDSPIEQGDGMFQFKSPSFLGWNMWKQWNKHPISGLTLNVHHFFALQNQCGDGWTPIITQIIYPQSTITIFGGINICYHLLTYYNYLHILSSIFASYNYLPTITIRGNNYFTKSDGIWVP